MDRTQWQKERRLWNEVRMDTIDARQYDERWGSYINPTHRAMIERFLTCVHKRDIFSMPLVAQESIGLFCWKEDFLLSGLINHNRCYNALKLSFLTYRSSILVCKNYRSQTYLTEYSVWMRWRMFFPKTGL